MDGVGAGVDEVVDMVGLIEEVNVVWLSGTNEVAETTVEEATRESVDEDSMIEVCSAYTELV